VQKASQGSASRLKSGISGAGAVARSLIGRLPGTSFSPGPVSAVSYRVASRIANTLRAGYPVRQASQLNDAPVVFFHSPGDQMSSLTDTLETDIEWTGKSLIICDCHMEKKTLARFQTRGASVAIARQFEIPGYVIAEGTAPALTVVQKLTRELKLKLIEVAAGKAEMFDAAITLGTCALTPLIESAAGLLREAGVRDLDAPRLAASLFMQTAREFAHSGKQSWGWYVKKPEVDRVEAQIQAASPDLAPVFQQLLLFGVKLFDKHEEVFAELRDKNENARPGSGRAFG
jgi:predicted short-subunit dehydrogenase-like oxidoreductase (DUF2520 family)